MRIFELQSRLNTLNITQSVTRPAFKLVPNSTSEIVAFDVTEIIVSWDRVIRNFIGCLKFQGP